MLDADQVRLVARDLWDAAEYMGTERHVRPRDMLIGSLYHTIEARLPDGMDEVNRRTTISYCIDLCVAGMASWLGVSTIKFADWLMARGRTYDCVVYVMRAAANFIVHEVETRP